MGSNEDVRNGAKCIKHAKPVQCDTDAANIRDDSNTDRFKTYQKSPTEVCVERTDKFGPWAMDLHFLCSPAEMVEIRFGTNEGPGETLCVDKPSSVWCDPDAANKRQDPHGDTFVIFDRDDKICVNRTDIPGAWGLNLKVDCSKFEANDKIGEPEKEGLTEATAEEQQDAKTGEPEQEAKTEEQGDAKIGEPEKEETKEKEEVQLQQKEAGASESSAEGAETQAKADEQSEPEIVKRNCSPRTMAVRLPEPLGPKLFILGDPVLHRYYTVYDWENKRVGFSLANTVRNTMDPSKLGRGVLPKEVDMLLMQGKTEVTRPKPSP